MTWSPPATPPGMAGIFQPEMAIRRVLIDGLAELAADPFKLDQVCARPDEPSPTGPGAVQAADFRAAFERLMATEGQLRVGLAFPNDQVPLPFVSVTADGGQEGEPWIGDIYAEGWRPRGEPYTDEYGNTATTASRRYLTKGTSYSSRVDVGVWSTVPEESVLLSGCVRAVLLLRRPRLARYGVHAARLQDTALRPDPTLNPRVMVVPIVQVALEWTLRITEREAPRPTTARFLPGKFGST